MAVFFCPENGRAAAGVRCLVHEAQGEHDTESAFRAAIRDMDPGWLKKIPKPGQRGREGSEAMKFAFRKTAAHCITPFSGTRRRSAGLLPVTHM